ncbi:MAG: hypothetical protein Kow006_07780 [Gammaproteobacteria bacterium]
MNPSAYQRREALDQLGDRRIEKLLQRARSDTSPDEGALCCRFCGSPVTHETHRIARSGAHRHTFANPLKISFTIGCFATAEGCAVTGEATTAHTWFAGYAWRIAVCGKCESHLGWRFEGDRELFFALILDRLTACSPRSH